jgi:hypothetical protein
MTQKTTVLDLAFFIFLKSNFEICFRSVTDVFGFDLTGGWWKCYTNEVYLCTLYLVA